MEKYKVLVSSNNSATFLNFWPVVSRSWNTLFGVQSELVLVTKNNVDDTTMKKLSDFGKVNLLKTQIPAPIENLAKLGRWYWATKEGNNIVMIEDIDTIYLRTDYLDEKLKDYENNKILGIGREVNKDLNDYKGKFPVSNIVGTGYLFSQLFGTNPKESFDDFVMKFKGLRVFDDKEDPFNHPNNFSDESLIRALVELNKFKDLKIIDRNVDIKKLWLDRSWWPNNPIELENYLLVNFPRPLYNHRKKTKIILDFFYPNGYPWIFDKFVWTSYTSTTFSKIMLIINNLFRN